MSDPPPAHRLLTYRALAQLWGCSVEAAQERVRRQGWAKQPGNGRAVLVAVPLEALEALPDDPGAAASETLAALRAERERELQTLRERAEQAEAAAEEARRDAREQRDGRLTAEGEARGLRLAVETGETARRDAEARAAAAVAKTETVILNAGKEVAQAQVAHAQAETAAHEARRKAEAAEARLCAFRALPWWRRIVTTP